jgi:hypothetical protein
LIINNVGQSPNTKYFVQQAEIQISEDFVETPDVAIVEKLLNHLLDGVSFEIGQNGEVVQGKERICSD